MRRNLISLAAVALLAGCVTTTSSSRMPGQPNPTAAPPPEYGDAIPNLTLVENQIKAYYGDTITVDGQHVPSATGNYAKEVARIEADARNYLAHYQSSSHAKPAIVLDVDDTSLNTYNYEVAFGFAYSPSTNADYINGEKFPAVFGMPELANWAASEGYTVFFVTGRPESQRDGTAHNLTKVGFTVPSDTTHLFLRNKTSPPPYLTYCEPRCTTIEYKSGTRAYIESLGYEIVANFGDQESDRAGGHTGRPFKMPNPMYYLP